MANKEFEHSDPMLLKGTALPGDTEEAMAEAFVEEFMLMGYIDDIIFKIFENPDYSLAHKVLKSRGEKYVRDLITKVRSTWGNVRYTVKDTPSSAPGSCGCEGGEVKDA